jgi:hypothetical protein
MAAPVPVWTGTVTQDGKLALDARELFTGYVKRLKGYPVQLVLKKRQRANGHQKGRYLFGVVYPVIADALGYMDYEVEEVHDAVMRELRGLRAEPNPLKLRVSYAAMSDEEKSAYITDVRHWAVMTFGCVTPDANQAEAA